MSEDHGQAIFDTAEELANLLAYLDGCNTALLQLLDHDLARRSDRGRPILAVLEAQSMLHAAANERVAALTRRACDLH